MNTKAWRIIIGSMLVLLFLTKAKLAAPPRGAVGNQIESAGVTAQR